MTSSLVGSEMCIRDRVRPAWARQARMEAEGVNTPMQLSQQQVARGQSLAQDPSTPKTANASRLLAPQ
eukprot:1720259-Prorocentrum_lima.AAC.1